MNPDDETLMAYADGELDAGRHAEIAAAIERDPELARRVRQFQSLRQEVAGTYSTVLDQPMPDRLRDTARAGAKLPKENVVLFPARNTRAPRAPWRAREWFAVAASLVVGMLLSWKLLPTGGEIDTKLTAVAARGELMMALDSQLAGDPAADAAVLIGLTFQDQQGAYCRTFIARTSSTAGLACRQSGDWRIVQTNAIEIQSGDLRQAAAALPASLLHAIEARIAGEPLDAAAEKTARDAGWNGGS